MKKNVGNRGDNEQILEKKQQKKNCFKNKTKQAKASDSEKSGKIGVLGLFGVLTRWKTGSRNSQRSEREREREGKEERFLQQKYLINKKGIIRSV